VVKVFFHRFYESSEIRILRAVPSAAGTLAVRRAEKRQLWQSTFSLLLMLLGRRRRRLLEGLLCRSRCLRWWLALPRPLGSSACGMSLSCGT